MVCNFNPRSPRGERRRISHNRCGRFRFQSTLPARGATLPQLWGANDGGISIHAPREGSDAVVILVFHHLLISIHAPREGSDAVQAPSARIRQISIHAPREGSDGVCESIRKNIRLFQSTLPARGATIDSTTGVRLSSISIHAPREGSDTFRSSMRSGAVDFNPRSPRGERRDISCSSSGEGQFQSTLPARGATETVDKLRRRWIFQSTLPARGATRQE